MGWAMGVKDKKEDGGNEGGANGDGKIDYCKSTGYTNMSKTC